MKKLPAAVLLCAVLFVLASFSVRADGGFVFAKSDNGGSYILTSYNGGAAEAVIPGEYNGLPVSKIAANAFSGSVSTYKIVIPASVTEIEPGAFDGMASLHEFEAAGNYTAVGGALFTKDRKTLVRYPQALEGKYTVPDGTAVGDRAFTGSALSYVDAKGASSIGDHAFYLSEIKNADLSAKLSFIGAHAFEKSALVTVTVPGATSVAGYAFSNCSSLEYADLKNAEITGEGVFYGDISLLAVSYPARMTEVFDLTFAGCLSLVTAPTGEKTERIGEKAFFGCASLEYASCGGASYNDGSFGLCSVIPDDKSYVKVPSAPDAITLAVGRSYRLFNGGEYDVFTSSHIVRSDNGVITALYEGEAFVYVVSRRGGDCKAVRVTVSDGDGIIESDHPYDTGRQSFSYTVSGSPKRIAVTFSSSDMLTESDSITVYDKNGNSYGTFTGGRLAGKTLFLDGDRIRIELTSVTGGSYGFRVVSAVPADSLTKIKTISVSPSVSINEGEEYALSPVISPSGAFPSELLYVSSDSSVAKVSADGTVRGVGGGAAVITVYSSFYGVSAECAVTVNGRDTGDFEYEIRENKAFITGYNGFDRSCVIPDTVDGYTVYGIADGAFSYGNIKSVFIPSTVCVIESRAFDGCSSLTAFDVAEDNPAYSSSGAALYDKDKTTLIKAAGGVKGVLDVGYAENIMPGAFSYCFGIEEIVLPAGLKNVSGAAFRYCTALKRITADGENYLSVDGVLYTSDSKTLVFFPADMNVHTYTVIPQAENIGEYAFSGASALVGLVLPENVRAIDGKALCEAFSLSDVKVNTNNRFYSVKDGCLLENGALKFVPKTTRGVFTVPGSVGEILPFALYNCSLISEVVFPSRIVSVGEYAFGNCTKLFDLFLPESVKKIGYDTFENDTAMTRKHDRYVSVVVPGRGRKRLSRAYIL